MREEILKKVDILYTMWKQRSLDGEIMCIRNHEEESFLPMLTTEDIEKELSMK